MPHVERIVLRDTIPLVVSDTRMQPSLDAIRLWDAMAALVRRSPGVRYIRLLLSVFVPELYERLLRAVLPGTCQELIIYIKDTNHDTYISVDTSVVETFLIQQPLVNVSLSLPPRALEVFGPALRRALPLTQTMKTLHFLDTELNEVFLEDVREGMQRNTTIETVDMPFEYNHAYQHVVDAIRDRTTYNAMRQFINLVANNTEHVTELNMYLWPACVIETLLSALANNTHVGHLTMRGTETFALPPELYRNTSVHTITVLNNHPSESVRALTAFTESDRTRPWTPQAHSTFPVHVQERIITGEMVFARLNRGREQQIPPEIRQMVWRFFTPAS